MAGSSVVETLVGSGSWSLVDITVGVVTPGAHPGLGVLAAPVRSSLVVVVPVVEVALEAPLEVGSSVGSVGILSSGEPASSVPAGLGSVRGLGPWVVDRFGSPELGGFYRWSFGSVET